MQAVVEAASGEHFEDYLTKHVWRPAGMVNTEFDVPSRVVPNRGHGCERDSNSGQFKNAQNEDVSYKYAGGGDLGRIVHAAGATACPRAN
jgi:CubicO group peptidase (beta-lactamase class C family)